MNIIQELTLRVLVLRARLFVWWLRKCGWTDKDFAAALKRALDEREP